MALYNLKNPAVKRLMKEAEELRYPTEEYHAQPLDDNLFEWHFTLRGPPNTDYEGGIYHGRISLPPDYPMKPPSIILLTPNGRFEINKKICLSISGHHPESWQPSWSIRTALLAIIGFMPTHGNGAIGSLDYSAEERHNLAVKSEVWKCPDCGSIKDIFLQKKYYCLKDDTCAPVLKDVSERDHDLISTDKDAADFVENDDANCIKKSDGDSILDSNNADTSNVIPETHDAGTLVLRHKSTVASNGVEPTVDENEPKQSATRSVSNILSLVCIWLIIFAIMLLMVRRLFIL